MNQSNPHNELLQTDTPAGREARSRHAAELYRDFTRLRARIHWLLDETPDGNHDEVLHDRVQRALVSLDGELLSSIQAFATYAASDAAYANAGGSEASNG